jgi:DMSO/TMAO reductase YedYZ molybdopterin-dependent catalytic subunit
VDGHCRKTVKLETGKKLAAIEASINTAHIHLLLIMQFLRQHNKLVLISFSLILVMAFSVTAPVLTRAATLYPDEVTQYQGQNLTPISTYIDYLNAHPDVAIKGAQYINQSSYQLAITGLVNNPPNYSYPDVINNFNSTLEVATLPCIDGWSVTLLWQGVPIMDLLQSAGGVSPDANTVIFYASDGYSSSLPLDYIKQNNIIVAYKINNVTLTPQTGWPLFLVAKDQYGYKWVEWITEINVSSNSDYQGYWESRGYPNNASVSGGGQGGGGLDYQVGVAVFAVFIVVAVVAAVFVYRRDKQRKLSTEMYKQALNNASLY